MIEAKPYFKNLDAIRFIAALMVFMGHGIAPAFNYLHLGRFTQQFVTVFTNGATGVVIFFVLSGFLITYLLLQEQEKYQSISLKRFYIRRILRIWPLYYLVILFSFIIIPYLQSLAGSYIPSASHILYYISFLSNFDILNLLKSQAGYCPLTQNITWSVSIEEQFYLFWPLLFILVPKRAWLYAIIGMIIGSIVYKIMNSTDFMVLYMHTFSVLVNFGAGGLLAYAVVKNAAIRGFFERCSNRQHILLFLIAFLLVYFNFYLFSFQFGEIVGSVLIAFSFAFIIAAQALTKTNTVFNLGNMSFAQYWGKYTYGIYLIHPIALVFVDLLMQSFHLKVLNFWSSILAGLAGLALTLILSKLSYQFYESKFLVLKQRFERN